MKALTATAYGDVDQLAVAHHRRGLDRSGGCIHPVHQHGVAVGRCRRDGEIHRRVRIGITLQQRARRQ